MTIATNAAEKINMPAAYTHHLQVQFRNKDGSPMANTRYRFHFNDQWLKGTTNADGFTELVEGNAKPVEVWIVKDGEKPERVGVTKPLLKQQKPIVVARQVEQPLVVKAQTDEHSKKPTTKVQLKKYSLQFKVPSFNCSGTVSYRMVQDGKVVAEGRTKSETLRIYTDSESEVSLYVAGDKRYKKGDAYVEEKNETDPITSIPPWTTASPSDKPKHRATTAPFDKHDWVDVSKIYSKGHPDVIPESYGIYAGSWTPPPSAQARDRRYVVTVDGRQVELYWEAGSCDDGLLTKGRKTCTTFITGHHWYMTVEHVIARTHPKVFKVLFDIIKEHKLTHVRISSSWRPGIGSSAHREGRALDITLLKVAGQQVQVKDFKPGTQVVDTTDTPSGAAPDLVEKIRKSLYDNPGVEQIFTPWHGMFRRGTSMQSSFKSSYVFKPVPPGPNPGETQEAFKARREAAIEANKNSGVTQGESGVFNKHRNHLHFHIKLD